MRSPLQSATPSKFLPPALIHRTKEGMQVKVGNRILRRTRNELFGSQNPNEHHSSERWNPENAPQANQRLLLGYIKTPELAREYFGKMKPRPSPATYCVFKPVEQFLQDVVKPEVVVFFASPDMLSGLFTLANYALEKTDAVYTPFGSGCSAILTHPLREAEKDQSRVILGMFDVSARPMVEKDVLTIAMPYSVFLKLSGNVSGSFLQTESWKKVLHRIQKK